MSAQTAIEWTNTTWNPILGCSILSPGCHNCYAMSMATRLKGVAEGRIARGEEAGRFLHYREVIDQGRWNGRMLLLAEALDDPLRWKRPQMIFVNSMSDLFHENLEVESIRQVCEVMRRADHHIYQVLTKRAARMRELLTGPLAEYAGLSQVWWGTSVENRRHGVPRIEELRQVPARVRFLSIEPLLEDLGELDLTGIHWVIAGGESGTRSRGMEADWVRSIRDQCAAQGVRFFFKQWGGRNKKQAGRLLDGRTHDELPELIQLRTPRARDAND